MGVGEVQRNINLVDLAKSFQTSIYLQKLASIQSRTSHLIFFNFSSLQGFNFHRPPAPDVLSCTTFAESGRYDFSLESSDALCRKNLSLVVRQEKELREL